MLGFLLALSLIDDAGQSDCKSKPPARLTNTKPYGPPPPPPTTKEKIVSAAMVIFILFFNISILAFLVWLFY